MKKLVALLLMLLLVMSASAALAYPRVLTDQAGREVAIDKEPERIVSGYYISTSACIALGLETRMAAIEAKADTRNIYALAAPELIDLPSVGTAKSFDLEACLAAEPDLVILPKRLSDAAQELSAFGIPVLLVNPESEALLSEMIMEIGIATDTQERAEDLIAFGVSQLGLCGEMLSHVTPVSALMLGNSEYLTCAPGDMYQSDVLAGAGAVNAAAEWTGGTWAQLSYEQLLAMNPQVLVIPAEAAYTAEDVLSDPELSELEAVKSGAVYAMPKGFEAWDSPVPSGVLGTLWLASELHPDAYGRELYVQAAKTLYETYYGFTPDEAAL
ncbi:MAG: ABC transporter substrate-binding protein [Clostridia bacterium]|nr:ABC transporter substrate-binding protein [Clostridia bacterium]